MSKFIECNIEYIPQEIGLDGMYKHIEIAARNCYKSEGKITEDSFKTMIQRLIKSKHLSMLEHGTIYLICDTFSSNSQKYLNNPYSKVINIGSNSYITTNYRVIYENKWFDDMNYLCNLTKFHQKRITFKFNTNIGVSRESNRHRVMSIAEESTRYCNYHSDKFNNQITFCAPKELQLNEKEFDRHTLTDYFNIMANNQEESKMSTLDYYIFSLLNSEYCYMNLIRLGWTAQQARDVLPLATKSSVIYTAFEEDWNDWINKRYYGTTGASHPEMKEIATKVFNILKANK